MDIQLRIAAATEAALAHCIAESAWRGRRGLPRNWMCGQLLAVKVADAITALATVTGQIVDVPEAASLPGYIRKIPVDWVWIATVPGERVQIGDWAKDVLREYWGVHYGFKILNQTPLAAEASQKLLMELFDVAPESLRRTLLEVLPADIMRTKNVTVRGSG